MNKTGLTILEFIIIAGILGILAIGAIPKIHGSLGLSRTRQEALALAAIIDTAVIHARLTSSQVLIMTDDNRITVTSTPSPLNISKSFRSRLSGDSSEFLISPNGVVKPATLKLVGSTECLIIVSLRGRVRIKCN